MSDRESRLSPVCERPEFAMCARAQRREGVLAFMSACRFGKRKGVFHVQWRPHSTVPRRHTLRGDARLRRLHNSL